MTRLTFLGAAGEVTGSCHLVESAGVLLVESTYGNRSHKSRVQTSDAFAYALRDEIRRQGWSAQVSSPGQTIEIA